MSIPGLDASSYTVANLQQRVMPEASWFHVHEWGKRGWLTVTHASSMGARHHSAKWVILRGSFERFLVNPEAWHTWKVETIRILELREWAREMRECAPRPWLSGKEYAALHNYVPDTIQDRIRRGHFEEAQVSEYGKRYYIRHDAPCVQLEQGGRALYGEPMGNTRLRAPRECVEWYREQGSGNVSAGMRAVWERERMRDG